MKKIGLLLMLICICSACDPMYHLIVVNYTDEYKQVTLQSKIDSAYYYKAIPDEIFKEGEKLAKKAMYPLKDKNERSRLVTVEVPPHQRAVLCTGIGRYMYFPIIINNDTIKQDSVHYSKWRLKAPENELGNLTKNVIVLK